MSLEPELEKTVSLIIKAQQKSLIKLIEKENNWDLGSMDSSSSTKKSKSSLPKRGRGRPRKDKTNLSVIYGSQKKESGEKNIPYSDGRILETH